MEGTACDEGPPVPRAEQEKPVEKKQEMNRDSSSRSQEQSESMSGSSNSGKTANKNDETKKGGRLPKCRWSPIHGELLKHTYRQFSNDREFIVKLFPGFSKRLIHRKIGEIKAEIEGQEWLEKHDEILIKAILKGATNWSKIAKRYLPRKSLDHVLLRVGQLKSKLKIEKAKLDCSGHSIGKPQDEDDSFQSTKHTERTGDESGNNYEAPILTSFIPPLERVQYPQLKDIVPEEARDDIDFGNFERELSVFASRQENLEQYFDWHDNIFVINTQHELEYHLDHS